MIKALIDELRLTNLQQPSGRHQLEKARCLMKSRLAEVTHQKGRLLR